MEKNNSFWRYAVMASVKPDADDMKDFTIDCLFCGKASSAREWILVKSDWMHPRGGPPGKREEPHTIHKVICPHCQGNNPVNQHPRKEEIENIIENFHSRTFFKEVRDMRRKR